MSTLSTHLPAPTVESAAAHRLATQARVRRVRLHTACSRRFARECWAADIRMRGRFRGAIPDPLTTDLERAIKAFRHELKVARAEAWKRNERARLKAALKAGNMSRVSKHTGRPSVWVVR